MDLTGKKEKLTRWRMDLESLPDEIIWNILARVSTLDLIGLQCVCKRWKSIIEEPSFRQLQSSCSASNPGNNRFIVLQQCDRLFFVGLHDKTRIVKRELVNHIYDGYKPMKSHNGLLCYLDDSERIIIMNPFTNQHVLLPEFDDIDDIIDRDALAVCGFVFNPTTNSYKVVVHVECDPPGPHYFEYMIIDSASKRWRSIGEAPFGLVNSNLQVLVNERLHWWPAWPRMAENQISSFDLINETISMIRLPNVSLEYVELMAFDGRLCIVNHRYRQGQTSQLQFWIMKEYGDEKSWSNDFNIEPTIPSELQTKKLEVVLIGELDNGKLLLILGGDIILFYDLRVQDCRFLGSKEVPRETLGEKWKLLMDTASIHMASFCSITS